MKHASRYRSNRIRAQFTLDDEYKANKLNEEFQKFVHKARKLCGQEIDYEYELNIDKIYLDEEIESIKKSDV